MNTFYKEQKELFIKAVDQIRAIEFTEAAANYAKKEGSASAQVVDEIMSKDLEKFQTDFALTTTTIMQNFCNQMGFELSKKPTYLTAKS